MQPWETHCLMIKLTSEHTCLWNFFLVLEVILSIYSGFLLLLLLLQELLVLWSSYPHPSKLTVDPSPNLKLGSNSSKNSHLCFRMVGGTAYHPNEYFWIFLCLISPSSQSSVFPVPFPSWWTSRTLLSCHKLARFLVACHNSPCSDLWSPVGIIGDSCLSLFLVRTDRIDCCAHPPG